MKTPSRKPDRAVLCLAQGLVMGLIAVLGYGDACGGDPPDCGKVKPSIIVIRDPVASPVPLQSIVQAEEPERQPSSMVFIAIRRRVTGSVRAVSGTGMPSPGNRNMDPFVLEIVGSGVGIIDAQSAPMGMENRPNVVLIAASTLERIRAAGGDHTSIVVGVGDPRDYVSQGIRASVGEREVTIFNARSRFGFGGDPELEYRGPGIFDWFYYRIPEVRGAFYRVGSLPHTALQYSPPRHSTGRSPFDETARSHIGADLAALILDEPINHQYFMPMRWTAGGITLGVNDLLSHINQCKTSDPKMGNLKVLDYDENSRFRDQTAAVIPVASGIQDTSQGFDTQPMAGLTREGDTDMSALDRSAAMMGGGAVIMGGSGSGAGQLVGIVGNSRSWESARVVTYFVVLSWYVGFITGVLRDARIG